MNKKLISYIKPLLKSLMLLALVLTLALGHAGDAMAAGGGRMGGGSFRAPARSYSAPRTYAPPSRGYGGGYYPGGGIGFPFLMPTFFVGGGSLFTVLIFVAIAGFLFQSLRRSGMDDELGYDQSPNPTVSVTRLQVGLLEGARELQADLNKIALKADTSSTVGLTNVLQETSLALMRHPEYWTHASSSVQQTRLSGAEIEFNRLALSERSKFSRETLSNVNNQIKQAANDAVLVGADGGALATQDLKDPGEFIVVTLLVATQGSLTLPAINNPQDLRQALGQLGGVPSDRLLALEVLWTPQAEGDVLTRDDLLVEYPGLKMI